MSRTFLILAKSFNSVLKTNIKFALIILIGCEFYNFNVRCLPRVANQSSRNSVKPVRFCVISQDVAVNCKKYFKEIFTLGLFSELLCQKIAVKKFKLLPDQKNVKVVPLLQYFVCHIPYIEN